jgi:hypothetical protein
MFRRQPRAAVAALTAALALAVPAAGATAATTAPAVRTASPAVRTVSPAVRTVSPAVRTTAIGAGARALPGSLVCVLLVRQLRWAVLHGFTGLAAVTANVLRLAGCGGAAI